MYAKTLIDKARLDPRFRSDAAIARAIGVTPVFFHKVANGKAHMPAERAALLADLLGEDATYALKRAALDNAEGDLFTRLQKAFRVAAGVAGAVVLAGMATAPSPSYAGTIKTVRELPHTLEVCTDYTLSRLFAALALGRRAWLWMARSLHGDTSCPALASMA